jgi:hypothetical protein
MNQTAMAQQNDNVICECCSGSGARRYQLFSFDELEGSSGFHDEQEFVLCTGCARRERAHLRTASEQAEGLTREELIAELDRFFAASGVFDICGRCHQQGTGCCPPTCRVMGAAGCDPANKRGKTVFCAAFVCSALLNAISECDPEIGRTLRWIKRELGPAEFHIYEMITRVPAEAREPVRLLGLPKHYPRPAGLENRREIREKLASLTNEVLALRRQWHELEECEKL